MISKIQIKALCIKYGEIKKGIRNPIHFANYILWQIDVYIKNNKE